MFSDRRFENGTVKRSGISLIATFRNQVMFWLRVRLLSIIVLPLILLSACSFYGDDEVEQKKPESTQSREMTAAASLDAYRLVPGDRIKVTVVEHPDMSVEADIAEDGTIDMPLIGSIRAAGRTGVELRSVVFESLDQDYLVNPRVNVEILDYQPFFVLGQVRNPGKYDYLVNMDARQAVAIAGGYTRRANEDSISVTRVILGKKTTFDATRNTVILPGDVVEIGRRWF